MSVKSFLQGPNAGYAAELYERYLQDPNSVDAATRSVFENWIAAQESAVPAAAIPAVGTAPASIDILRVVGAARLARLIRELGHLAAHVDPLGSDPPGDPGLELATHGLQTGDLAALPPSVVGGPLAEGAANALEAMGSLRRVYSGTIGYETDHIQVDEERQWIRDAIETGQFFQNFDSNAKCDLLERLTEVDTFEQYLHQTFQREKRFSIEGTDMLVPMLDEIIHHAARAGTREVVMGMAHRGRLNVLAHVLGKPYAAILSEFEHAKGDENASVSGRSFDGWTGDVKYHLGARRGYKETGLDEMKLTLVPNPSHLEYVNPVVEGHARAAQERRTLRGEPIREDEAALPILIHGDAAFPGQGIVAETLNLSSLPGYRTGGTLHIIVNNQIGFTTLPADARSTLYAGDLAKGFEIPIIHVNADDPEACLAVARMAHAYRERFHKDFMVDLIGYRRYGHNEGDEPAFTQPRMYEAITAHSRARELWAQELERQGVVTRDEAQAMVAAVQERLKQARAANGPGDGHAEETERHIGRKEVATAVPAETLIQLNEALLARPAGFTVNAQLERTVFQRRRAGLERQGGIDWGHAEALAFASILADCTPIRLTGQDAERGTFNQRHLVVHDPITGARYVPLQNIREARASFAVYNSPLSESAPLGFEYGYSMHAPGVLALWEAQFGDFANSAQVRIYQFLVSGNAKWRQIPSLVLLLPHGYEGQGPDHSSARLERFLQLAANDNIRVVDCTTSAQYFHLLRRQAALLKTDPRPLIVMAPKFLLRHPRASSSLSDLTHGTFQPVIRDAEADARPERVTRLILCSGKVYVDLIDSKLFETAEGRENLAVARVEELYPFPEDELRAVVTGYSHLREIVWMQEEPCNMGAWTYIAPRLRDLVGWTGELIYAGRREAASPAEGSKLLHAAEQERILTEALREIPALPMIPSLERSEVSYAR
jgi:2-oxoglutarate dehydrogenase E1 component